jgi:hypothetical protein
MKKGAILEAVPLPEPIKITDDMLPTAREDALRHNAGLERLKLQRSLPAAEQIKMAFEWNGAWNDND